MPSGKLMREQLHPSVYFSSVRDGKFRHNSICINIITPLDTDVASATAILPFLLRKGSMGYPDYTLLEQQLCELYGANLSSDVVKYGDKQIITCSVSFVDDSYTIGGEIISDRCADLLGDMVLRPKIEDGAFDSADFEIERQNLIDTIEAEINDKRTYAINQCKAMMFDGSVYATTRYGTVEGAKALTPAIAAARYREVLDTATVEITFVGSGDPATARDKFRALFGDVNRHPAAQKSAAVPHAPQKVREQQRRMAVAQGKLVLGLRVNGVSDKQAVDAAKLMTTLYGGTPNSRLFVNVREKLSLCYYCAARYDRPTSTMIVDIGVESANRDKAQAAIMEQLSVLARGDWEDSELVETKLACANSLQSSCDSLSALESWYLVQLLEGEQSSPIDEITAYNNVTREAVCAAAGRVTLDSVYFLTGNGEDDE